MSAKALIQELEHESATTRRVLERVPGDRLGWKPHPKSMTIGGLAMHIAMTPAFITGWALQDSVEAVDGAPPFEPTSTDEIFADIDVLVTPTTMAMPPKIADAIAEAPSEIRLIRNTVPFNSLGIPTISVPCGFSRSGLPIGLQLSGPRLAEVRILALGHAYEQATEWRRRRPTLD